MNVNIQCQKVNEYECSLDCSIIVRHTREQIDKMPPTITLFCHAVYCTDKTILVFWGFEIVRSFVRLDSKSRKPCSKLRLRHVGSCGAQEQIHRDLVSPCVPYTSRNIFIPNKPCNLRYHYPNILKPLMNT